MSDFLLEIGLEEVPARMIAGAEAELGKRVNDLLTRERLLAPDAKLTTYSTPRRLAVLAEGVLAKQADTEEQLTGPSWKVAFKDGAPTPAAQAFAKKAGVAVAELKKVETPKGEYVGAIGEASRPHRERDSCYRIAQGSSRPFTGPRTCTGARQARALCPSCALGCGAYGLGNRPAGDRGHRSGQYEPRPSRFARGALRLYRFGQELCRYVSARQAWLSMWPSAGRSSARLSTRLRALFPARAGARTKNSSKPSCISPSGPRVILGDFEPEYLELPEEVLVTVMRDHQKYFAVEDANGKLAPHFLAVLNTQADQEGAAIIRHGNARVLRARFKDARFFWDFDQKTPLADRVESLKHVTFQKELGSYYWKTEQNLAVALTLIATAESQAAAFDESALFKAVELAKTDLTTELVKEFTELQGIIGGLYARAQGLGETVAKAIYDQYTPASIEDAIPSTVEGQLLGLADRIQTITAMFGIGNAPTGSKDPFALRRAANAIVKILAESDLPLTLSDVLDAAVERCVKPLAAKTKTREVRHALSFASGCSFYLKDVRNFAYDVVNAVLAADADDVRDAIARAEALTAARGSADFAAISAAFKRIKNILRQAEEKGFALGSPKSVKLAPEAQRLADAAAALAPQVAKLREQRAYGEALALIATLRPTVDAFFDKVMVLDPDETIRGAHLGLIDEVLRSFSGIADFSEIVTA